MYDKRSDQLAGMSVVELRHSEKRMLELAVFANEPGIDRLELPLVVDAACPAVYANIDTGCRRLKRLCHNAALSLVVGMYLP
jgi:hypothetical protein